MIPVVDPDPMATSALPTPDSWEWFSETGKRRAPAWMRRRGLSWLWRLALEPRRLWRRYLLLNPAYLLRLAAQAVRLWRPDPRPARRGSAPDAVPV